MTKNPKHEKQTPEGAADVAFCCKGHLVKGKEILERSIAAGRTERVKLATGLPCRCSN